jgi:protein-tyrosine phosphatase
MIDIHTHLLPDFDDGPANLDETREMLELAEKDGTRAIVITPHILDYGDYERQDEIFEKFEQVKEVARKDGRKLRLYLGGEIYLLPDIQPVYPFSTLNNNGKTILFEFSMREIPEFAPNKIFDWIMEGYQPILAHPERFLPILKNPRYAFKFAQMGVGLQINAGSVVGVFGEKIRRLAFSLIEHRMAHIVASDGHNTNSRSISLKEARQRVEERFGKKVAWVLFEENPRRAVEGEPLLREDPIPFEDYSQKPSRWDLIKRRLGLGKKEE